MVKLQINELTGRVMGVAKVDETCNKSELIIDDIANFVVTDTNGTRLLDNLYLRDGILKVLPDEPDDYYDLSLKIHKDISLVQDEISQFEKKVISRLLDGESLETLNSEMALKKNKLEELEKEKSDMDSKYLSDLNILYKTRDNNELKDLSNLYYSSICLLIRDENEYLEEWINHYISIGIDHIYIYDNGIKESVDGIINKFPSNYITAVKYEDKDTNTLQQDVYSDFLSNYASETRWVAFIDSDEFIYINNNSADINTLLKSYEEYGAIHMNWIVYNANGEIDKKDGNVQERFTTTLPEPINHNYNKLGKAFIQPYKIDGVYRYIPIFKNGNTLYINDDNNIDFIELRHYYTKSLEEWTEKINRGSCDARYLKKYEEFFKLNPDMQSLYKGEIISQRYNL